MTKEEILDYNKRCAEFLGVDKTLSSYYLPQFGLYKNRYGEVSYEEVFREDELKFHSDWNWIMEVYIKINKLIQDKSRVDFIFATETNDFHLNLWNAFEDENCSKEAVVQAINQFLIWYDENKR